MTELTQSRSRIQSLDILRGVVMVIMALDHVRDFFHEGAFVDNPTNLGTTTPILFFTRWITHYCAPVFVFLAGTSGFLTGQRRTKKQLSIFLLTRGLWLVFAEMALVSLALSFNPEYNLFFLQVIWAIGMSMIILGLLVWLPFYLILFYAVVVVFGHNLLDYPEAAREGKVGTLWNILHMANFFPVPISDNRAFIFVYAFFPWSGVMAMGYCFGKLFSRDFDPVRRRKLLFAIGFGLIALFIILRLVNLYGDPTPWSVQSRGGVYTFLSFLNVNKYPPSLMFLCMTIGPAIVVLALLENVRVTKLASFFRTFGRVPFFYYIIHFFYIHLLCVIAFYMSGLGSAQIVDQNSPFFFRPAVWGYNLWIVYAVWAFVVLTLYPLCRWYEKYKARNSYWWLSYV